MTKSDIDRYIKSNLYTHKAYRGGKLLVAALPGRKNLSAASSRGPVCALP
jgi:hypothetical protein